jgi:hypothetical protein
MKLTKEKRDHLILVGLITVAVLIGIWFGLINFQKQALAELGRRKDSSQRKLTNMKTGISNASEVEASLKNLGEKLSDLEEGMATGDLHLSLYNTIRRFRFFYKIENPNFSTVLVSEMKMLPRFPYEQVTLTVSGRAYYHDLGKFIAEFENQFPHIRIANLDVGLTPGAEEHDSDREKLQFKMDIVALVKP